MKKLIIISTIILGCLTAKIANAQVRVSLGVNFNSERADDGAAYYYMPDINAYYCPPTREYVYYDNDAWVRGRYLPERYGNYDIYHSRSVIVHERNPWMRNNYYQSRYGRYQERYAPVIERRNYYNYEREREHEHWDNGRHNGWYKHHEDGDRHHRDDD